MKVPDRRRSTETYREKAKAMYSSARPRRSRSSQLWRRREKQKDRRQTGEDPYYLQDVPLKPRSAPTGVTSLLMPFESTHQDLRFISGFTLIELLVVIGIIAILSTISLIVLNSARGTSADAAIKADLKTAQTQAAIVYANNDCYTDTTVVTPGICTGVFPVGNCNDTTNRTIFKEPKVAEALEQAGDSSSSGIASASCVQAAGSGAWAVSVPLKTTPLKSWCVDSNGIKREVTPVGADRGFNGTSCK